MKRLAIALLFIMVAASAQATTIQDIQTGLIVEGDAVSLTGVSVTAVRYNGLFVAEAPFGAFQQIWVYTGTTPVAVEGDIVDVSGTYAEYYDFSEVDSGVVAVVSAGTVPAPITVPAAVLAADGEPYESCLITVPDQLTVTALPSSYGEWTAESVAGDTFVFDDYWFDDTTVQVGDCYGSVTGVLIFGYGAYKIEPLTDGIVGCVVATDDVSFGTIKSLYR